MKKSSIRYLFIFIISLSVYAAEADAELEALKVQDKELSQRIEAYEIKKDAAQTSTVKDKKKEVLR